MREYIIVEAAVSSSVGCYSIVVIYHHAWCTLTVTETSSVCTNMDWEIEK